MKILILCRYSRLGASSRLRLFQFIPLFEREGISCVVHSLMNDRYLRELYAKAGISRINMLKGYLAMAKQVAGAGRFDLVIIEKEIFPYLPPLAEWWLSVRKIPYIVDYDDAIFHNYDLHPNRVVRWLLGRKIATVMRRSAAVVCGNEYLADYGRRSGARRVVVIPTVIDTDRYAPVRTHREGAVVVGWMGSPSSVKYVLALRPVLEQLIARYDIRLHLVGAEAEIGIGERLLDWSEAEEVNLLAGFDIGIMPLEDSPWEQGKCGYKLIQYMGSGLPVVGSPIGVNETIIEEGVSGFKPVDAVGWTTALESLILDETLRRKMGARGLETVRERFSLRGAAAVWISELTQEHVRNIRND